MNRSGAVSVLWAFNRGENISIFLIYRHDARFDDFVSSKWRWTDSERFTFACVRTLKMPKVFFVCVMVKNLRGVSQTFLSRTLIKKSSHQFCVIKSVFFLTYTRYVGCYFMLIILKYIRSFMFFIFHFHYYNTKIQYYRV